MAKEKSDKVRKGFFFYFGFFLLILVAVVLIIFVVMMFMPGTSILGLEYFTGEGTNHVLATTDESQTQINFDQPNFNSVEIDAGYASVSVQKNNEFEQNGIYIINNAKGFVTSAKANDFGYSVTLEDGTLKILVTEQNGFLYFSKDVRVVLQISNENINPFAGKSISIKNTDGAVYIGGPVNAGYSHNVDIGSLTVENGKGGIVLSSHSPSYFNSLNLTTSSGGITFNNPAVSAENMSVSTGSGDITAGGLSSGNIIVLNTGSGQININQISSFSSQCTDAYMNIGTVNGSADFTASADTFSSSVINIDRINGNITATQAQNSTFNLGTVSGIAYIHSSTGTINIASMQSYSNLFTTSATINAAVAQDASNVSIATEKGTLNITLPTDFVATTIENQAGETNLTLPENANSTIYFNYYGEDVSAEFNFDNVNLNLDGDQPTNPYIVGSGESGLTLRCNKTINFNWTQSA